MTERSHISAAQIAEAISGEIESYVDEYAIEFVAVENDRILCWYVNAGEDQPTYAIELARSPEALWDMKLMRQPEGAERPGQG